MAIVKNKWLVFLLLILAFVTLDTQIRHVNLAQRGIVLGIGIDKVGDEYEVTCEILSPSNLGAESYQKNRLVTSEKGVSLNECFEKMDKSVGVRISLKHTVLIVLGKSVVDVGDYSPLVDLFLGNEVADDTYIVGTEGNASELFKARPPMYRTISYKVAETFRSPDIESGVVSTNVKDFFSRYLSESGGIYIPMVRAVKGSMSESSGNGEEDTDSLMFGNIMILDKSGKKAVLTDIESEGLSYIFSKVNEANIYVDDGGDSFNVDIIETRSDMEYNVDEKRVLVKVTMWVKLGVNNVAHSAGGFDTKYSEKIELAGETIKKHVESALYTCHSKGVDILGIASHFMKRMGSEYKEYLGGDPIGNVRVDVSVRLIAK